MSDKPKDKKFKLSVNVPDIAKIGKRTFYIGLAALVLDSIISALGILKAPDTFLTMAFMTAYFASTKEILIIVLLGKIVAEKK